MSASPVVYNSAELAAYHEAGHVEVALAVGARVVRVDLYREEPLSFGRTRAERTDDQSRHIALGGFAAEYLLYNAKRLRKADGTTPTEKEFIDHAMDNAADDRLKLHGDLRDNQGDLPLEADRAFMSYAIGRSEQMDFAKVERLALALLSRGTLFEREIDAL